MNEMWKMKKSLLLAIAIVAVVLISMNMASADEKKTITPQEFATNIAEVPGKLVNFLGSEVEKTKAYQKESWAEMKTQTAQNWAQLKSLFGVKN